MSGRGEAGCAAPEVTVVVTTRDRPQLVQRAVDSALGQRAGGVEVVVVDDGSVPPLRLPERSAAQVALVRHDTPRGVCAARNTGLRAARGRWITYLDDDDELCPDMVRSSLAAARSSPLPPPVSVVSALVDVGAEGDELATLRPVSCPRGHHILTDDRYGRARPRGGFPHNTLFAPTEVLEAIGGWDESLAAHVHTDLFLRLAAASSLQASDQVTYRRTCHDGCRLSTPSAPRSAAIEKTVRKHPGAFPRGSAVVVEKLTGVVVTHLREGQWPEAIGVAVRSLRRLAPGRAVALLLLSLGGPGAMRMVDRIRSVQHAHRARRRG